MEITVHINRLDVIRSALFVMPRHRAILTLVGLATLGMFISGAVSRPPDNLTDWFVLVLVGLVGGIFVILVTLASTVFVALFVEGRGVLGENTITISEQGVREKTAYNESFHKWSGIYAVNKSRNYIYLRVTTGGFYPIPRRSFDSNAAFEEFWSTAYAHWKQAA